MQEHRQLLKLGIAGSLDILAAFVGVLFPCPHEGLSDEVRPLLKASHGGDPLCGTASDKVGFDDGEGSDDEARTFVLHPGWEIGMEKACALFGALHIGVNGDGDDAPCHVVDVLYVI